MGKAKKKSGRLAGHAARIEHSRRKLQKTRRALRDEKDVPAEVIEAIHVALGRLGEAIDLLDLSSGQAARDELTGEAVDDDTGVTDAGGV